MGRLLPSSCCWPGRKGQRNLTVAWSSDLMNVKRMRKGTAHDEEFVISKQSLLITVHTYFRKPLLAINSSRPPKSRCAVEGMLKTLPKKGKERMS